MQGAKNVKNLLPDSVGVFIMPPSFEILSKRLEARGSESSSDLAVRLLNARGEVDHYREFDYLIINDEIPRAASQLAAVFLAERARRARMESAVEDILKTFSLTD